MTETPKKTVAKSVLAKLARITTPTITFQLMRHHGLNNTCLRDVLPLDPDSPPFAGPAYTLRYAPLREDLFEQQLMDHACNLMTPAIEDAPEGAVFLMDAGGNRDAGLLGGNIVMRLKVRGLAAAVTDGAMRDIPEIKALGWPVCCTAIAAPASMVRLMLVDTQRPVTVGGVPVFPGDVIVGDGEGVVAVPAHLAEDVAEAGLAQDRLEEWVHRRLAEGHPIKGLYPPDETSRAAYEDWCARGAPSDET